MITPVIDSLPAEFLSRILCYYVNQTPQAQIVRITNIENWYFERIVFAGQRLLFEAVADAQLELYAEKEGNLLVDRISCNCLRVTETD
jgi:Domain of unknown function (DUF1830)